MLKSTLLDTIQREIYRHGFDTFVDNPPSVARGGNGIVVAGCPACKKRLQSLNEFLRHLARTQCRPCWIVCPNCGIAEANLRTDRLYRD